MGSYVPTTRRELSEMLKTIGISSLDELYESVPKQMLLSGLNLPSGKSELAVRAAMAALADQNTRFATVLRGAGAYRHFIPAAVKSITAREELVTAYTPYQAEISQGLLQSIFEYQTMICELTGMDVSNASVYDGATAAAEAVAMCRDRKRTRAYLSACAHPDVIETVKTYCFGADTDVVLIPETDGKTDKDALRAALADDAAACCVYFQQPNYYGLLEDAAELSEIAHTAGAKSVMGVNPIACAVLKTPAECGADVAVGEGQPLGMPLSFGGPYLGFMASTSAMMRKLPGRIVGETTDKDGRRGYVLTLTAREQHIRREKASSNICSNEALCAMTAAIYMSAMGETGLKQAAMLCTSKAHYFASELQKIGLSRLHGGEFFHEFVVACTDAQAKAIELALEKAGILAGLPVAGGMLFCVTEVVTKAELDRAVRLIAEVIA